jgi:hypothetical protein
MPRKKTRRRRRRTKVGNPKTVKRNGKTYTKISCSTSHKAAVGRSKKLRKGSNWKRVITVGNCSYGRKTK